MKDLLKRAAKYHKIVVGLVDLALVNLAYLLAFLIKFNLTLPDYNFVSYLKAMPFITLAALIFFDIFGMLKFYGRTVYDTLTSIALAVILLAVTATAITYFLGGFSFPRSVLLIAPVLQLVLLSLWKLFLLKVRKYVLRTKCAMIIGDIREHNASIEKVKHVMEEDNVNIKYIFGIEERDAIFKRIGDMDEVFICADVPADLKMDIITNCLGGRQVIYVIPHLFEISLLNSRLTQFNDIPAFMIGTLDLSLEQKFFKRIFDIVISLMIIIISLPLMLLFAAAVMATSRGGAIYSQKRVTRNNRIFKVYKFRTMVEGAEERTGPVLSDINDPRITVLGRFLRRTRLDELPQFFNVLKGDMSIVGPRPERPYFVEQFSRNMPEYKQRYAVRAGITGYAQIFGNYDTATEDKLRYDLMYIKEYSLLLDIKLILQTLRVVFTGSNMYEKNVYRRMKSAGECTGLKDKGKMAGL